MKRLRRVGVAFLAIALLAACQTESGPGEITVASTDSAYPTMDRVVHSAVACWFKSNDPAFSSYRLASELNSYSGRPRLLIVAKSSPESRPLAVIQAEGKPASVQAFGPLMSQSLGSRIAADVKRWTSGSAACGSAA